MADPNGPAIAANLRLRWAKAFSARDLEGLARLYTPDVLFFGSTPPLYEGHDGVRAYFGTLADDVVLEAFEEPEIRQVSPGVLATAGFWRFRFGAEARRYRLTWVLVEQGGGWLIAQHHAARVD